MNLDSLSAPSPPHVPQAMITSDDSRIPRHGTHCPVPGFCPGSSHGWMPSWALHLPLAWGAGPVSSWEWLTSPALEGPSSTSLSMTVIPC